MQEGYGSHHFSVEVAALSVSYCLDVRYYSQSRRRGQSPRGIALVDFCVSVSIVEICDCSYRDVDTRDDG